ncbi:MAG: cytochrome c peroxidase [Woeseiaceae bacterium]|nr:cytochrome c peroxidase [Woeseiaceae bacterium]
MNTIIAAQGLTSDPTAGRSLPSINDPLAQLGMKLFFSKSLSGDMDTACASCHHPALGGGDALSLPVGVGAVDPDVVGPGRTRADGLPNVGRHSQSVFNVGLLDAALFWDGRIESIGKEEGLNGAGSGIRTPHTPLNAADPNAGPNLVAAQARFPVTIPSEMRGSLMPTATDEEIWDHLAARIGDYGTGAGELTNNNWLTEFQTAFMSAETAENLITFDNIALAIAEYQRSMVFVDTPWHAYVGGDLTALSDNAKRGAILFFGDTADQNLDCASCHSGDMFTDEEHHTVGFTQIGPGKGDTATGDGDFGREQQTADTADRFRFRTPTLLNLGATGPYTHAGAFDDLTLALQHYFLPDDTRDDFFNDGGACSLDQFQNHPDCPNLFPNSLSHSNSALSKVATDRTSAPDRTFPDLSFSPPSDAPRLLAFLNALNDPCVSDRACVAPWIPDPASAPDDNQLNAVDENGNPL